MSKSYKKNVIVKDRGAKTILRRIERHRNNQRVKEGKEPLQRNEITNQYDYCDYVFIISKNDKNYNKYKRK